MCEYIHPAVIDDMSLNREERESYWCCFMLQLIVTVFNISSIMSGWLYCWQSAVLYVSFSAFSLLFAEPVEGPPTPGGPHICSGASSYIWKKNFLVFLMFSKYLWRYSCIMKSTRELEAPQQARSQGWGCDGWVSTPSHAKMVRLVEYRYLIINTRAGWHMITAVSLKSML